MKNIVRLKIGIKNILQFLIKKNSVTQFFLALLIFK